jgi:hypothetical protein
LFSRDFSQIELLVGLSADISQLEAEYWLLSSQSSPDEGIQCKLLSQWRQKKLTEILPGHII